MAAYCFPPQYQPLEGIPLPVSQENPSFHFDRRIVWVISAIALVFVTLTASAHLVFGAGTATLIGFRQLIDVDGEGNLPTWYASALLHFAAFLAWIISAKVENDTLHWRIIALLLLLMGIDEIASLHNAPSRRLGEFLGTRDGVMMNAWVIPGAILVVIVAFSFLRFLYRQKSWMFSGLIISAGLYVTGALILESVGTVIEFEEAGLEYDGDQHYSLSFELIAVAEEAFEYAGVILTIYLFLRMASELGASMTLSVRNLEDRHPVIPRFGIGERWMTREIIGCPP